MRSHHGADSVLQKGVASWSPDEVRWCCDVRRLESAYPVGINRQTPSWAPLSSPAFLDLFAILLVIQPFEATWWFFFLLLNPSHLHFIPCLSFHKQCLDRHQCSARKMSGKAPFYSCVSKKPFWEEESTLSPLNNALTIWNQTVVEAGRDTVCRKYNIQIGQPTQRSAVPQST